MDIIQIQVSVRIPAPPEKVFAAFADPEKSKKWYCLKDMVPGHVELDVRTGGRYIASMKILNESFVVSGEYKEVIPNEKLVFTQQWEDPLMHKTLTTVLFRPRGEVTDVHLIQENFANEDDAEAQRSYWQQALETLSGKFSRGEI
jgi:uncharacterized protein YndB with AHSA1/START domain